MDFDKKGNRDFFTKKLLFKTLGVLFLAGILFLVVEDVKIYQKKKQLSAQVENYEKQIESIKKSSQTLKDEIANSDNVDYLEKLGYEQLDQTRPGETEYMFINPPGKAKDASNTENSWFGNVWQWIKNRF